MERIKIIGAFDSNENQIFEGDILRKNEKNYLIVYEKFYCAYGLLPIEFPENDDYENRFNFYDKFSITTWNLQSYSIIGNIYEDPQLFINSFKS